MALKQTIIISQHLLELLLRSIEMLKFTTAPQTVQKYIWRSSRGRETLTNSWLRPSLKKVLETEDIERDSIVQVHYCRCTVEAKR